MAKELDWNRDVLPVLSHKLLGHADFSKTFSIGRSLQGTGVRQVQLVGPNPTVTSCNSLDGLGGVQVVGFEREKIEYDFSAYFTCGVEGLTYYSFSYKDAGNDRNLCIPFVAIQYLDVTDKGLFLLIARTKPSGQGDVIVISNFQN